MTDLEFGLTLTAGGMGGTLIILYVVSLTISAANKFFPFWEKRRAKLSPRSLPEKSFPREERGAAK